MDKQPEDSPPEHMDVLPENWLALQIFLQCQTQWRVIAGMGGAFYQGLDYPSVDVVIRLQAPKKKRRKTFQAVQLIEQGALSRINEKN
nr:DUF1799 domain-containing protein [Oceanospirillum sediminis]